MPLRRCKFYDDDGKPVGTGCHREGKGCDFIHPNDPLWSSSPSIRRGDSGDFASRGRGGRGRGRGDRSVPGSGRANASADHASDGWGAPPSASATSGWDTSSWGATTGWGAADASKEQAQDGGWGGADSGSRGASDTSKPKTQDGGGGWGKPAADSASRGPSDTSKPRAQDGGWGKPAADSGSRGTSDASKAKAQDGGWGQAGSDGGWRGNPGASDTSAADGGWGQPGPIAASSTSDAGEWGVPGSSEISNWGRRTAVDLNGSARDAPAKDSKQTPAGRKDSRSSSLPRAPRRLSVDKPLLIPPSGSWADSNRAVSPPRPPRRYSISTSAQDDAFTGDWSHVTCDNGGSKAPSLASSTDLTASTSRLQRQMPTTTLSDRQKVWRNLIRHTARAVGTESELRQLEQNRDHWKSAQSSSYYGHAGPFVREKLNDTRKEDEKNISDCKKRLFTSINALVEFPDMSQILATNFSPETDQAEAREYISTVKEWVDGRRSTIPLQPEPQDAPPTRDTSVEEGQIEPSRSAKRQRSSTPANDPQRLTSRCQQTEDRLKIVEQKCDETHLFRQYTILDQLPVRSTQTEEVPERYVQLSATASQLKSDVYELKKSTAPVLSEANDQGEVLKHLRAERDQVKRDNVLMQEQQLGFQKLLEEDSVLVRQTYEHVQQLLTNPRVAHSPSLVPNDSIVAHATDAILQDLRPLLDGTFEKCQTHVQEEYTNMFTKVWNKLEPTIKLKRIEVNHNRGRTEKA